MTYYVRSPGTCGEFIQGAIKGKAFLVTCPINRFSYALSDVSFPLVPHRMGLQPKARQAWERTLQLLNIPTKEGKPVYVRSDIVQGKGMASSTADISATAMATALAHGHRLTVQELEKICLSIEPTDASFYPSIVQFDYRNGEICEPLGVCPPMNILIFDEGGEVDTISFNQRHDLLHLINEKESYIEEALALFKDGLLHNDISQIGAAATLSSFANQRILPKTNLYDFHAIGVEYNSVGTIIAHSGTIMGLIFPTDAAGLNECKRAITSELPHLTFVDMVTTTCEGITFVKR